MRFVVIEKGDLGSNMFEQWEHPYIEKYCGTCSSIDVRMCEGQAWACIEVGANDSATHSRLDLWSGEYHKKSMGIDNIYFCLESVCLFKMDEE